MKLTKIKIVGCDNQDAKNMNGKYGYFSQDLPSMIKILEKENTDFFGKVISVGDFGFNMRIKGDYKTYFGKFFTEGQSGKVKWI